MVNVKFYSPTVYTVADNIYRNYYDMVLSDMSNILKIDNKKVFERASYNNDSDYATKIRRMPNDSHEFYGLYYPFCNDFASFDCGLMLYSFTGDNKRALFTCRSQSDINVDDTFLNIATVMVYSADEYTANKLSSTPCYYHVGSNIVYLGFEHPTCSVIFAKLKSIDDPSTTKPVVIFVGKQFALNSYLYPQLGYPDSITILENNTMQVTSYNTYFSHKLTSNNITVENFVYNGYFSDEIVILDGDCPKGLFKLGNDTFLNIAFDMYIKVDSEVIP